ncbi:MAG TPA: hypothetical protein DDW24_05990 [Blastocatellia bacterium]|nr:hypothetical protein [Blastocatellia bacterium]
MPWAEVVAGLDKALSDPISAYVYVIDTLQRYVDVLRFYRHIVRICRWHRHVKKICRRFPILSTYPA